MFEETEKQRRWSDVARSALEHLPISLGLPNLDKLPGLRDLLTKIANGEIVAVDSDYFDELIQSARE